MNNPIKQDMTTTLEKGMVVGDKYHKEGTKLTLGVNCPNCKKFHPYAVGLTACNYCGWRQKRIKPHQLKKAMKIKKREEFKNAKTSQIKEAGKVEAEIREQETENSREQSQETKE